MIPVFLPGMGQKHKELTGLTLHILCLYFSHMGRRCSSHL